MCITHYGLDIPAHPNLKNLSTLDNLCHGLVTSGKANMYLLVDISLQIVLTLHVSTTTSKRDFLAMKILKTSLKSNVYEFLGDYLLMYVKKKITETICVEEIINSFYFIKDRRAYLK